MPNDDRPPAFMFYPADFASDGKVEAMTTEEVGAYILLLCKAWREDPPGSVPDDDRVLARWARMTSEQWSAARSAVLDAFTQGKDGRWYQPRMVREYEKQRSFAKSRHNAAKVAASKRWENHKDDASRIRHASGGHSSGNGDAPSSSSSSGNKNTRAREPVEATETQVSGLWKAIQDTTGVIEGDLVGERKLQEAVSAALNKGFTVEKIEQFRQEKGVVQIAYFLSAFGAWLKAREPAKPSRQERKFCGKCKGGYVAVDPANESRGMKRCECNPSVNGSRGKATA